MERLIEIEGTTYCICKMKDEAGDLTDNPAEACNILVRDPNFPADARQPYWMFPIVKGSLEQDKAN
jgi:hypothetical protein